MTRALVAEFDDADRFIAALKASKAEGLKRDSMRSCRSMIPEAARCSAGRFPPVRPIMAIAGFGMAVFAYALQWYSAVVAYPITLEAGLSIAGRYSCSCPSRSEYWRPPSRASSHSSWQADCPVFTIRCWPIPE